MTLYYRTFHLAPYRKLYSTMVYNAAVQYEFYWYDEEGNRR